MVRAALIGTIVIIANPFQAIGMQDVARRAQYSQASWSVKDGLPSNLIWAIAQDQAGYLWIGTDAGVVRFDGVRFSSWESLSRPALSARAVRSVLVSKNGDLWIGYGGAGGLSRFH